ncbi:hypothetical protein PIB30_058557 [Stylosanthes scabra]|uniref:Uncharacterized protein n=1 Tax=Stylosanthes scabra TaxID=79078 RepID=A0ABU6VIF1_9FABA|nr:hypothetical protein [Stylosanthes scabra]
MLPVSFGADRSGSPPTPPPRAVIRALVRRTPCYTAPEYHRLFRTQLPRESSPVPRTLDDEAESKDTSKSTPSSGSSSRLYSTDTSSSDVTFGRSYDSTGRSSGSSSDVTFGSDPRSPWPCPSISSGSYTFEDDLVDSSRPSLDNPYWG